MRACPAHGSTEHTHAASNALAGDRRCSRSSPSDTLPSCARLGAAVLVVGAGLALGLQPPPAALAVGALAGAALCVAGAGRLDGQGACACARVGGGQHAHCQLVPHGRGVLLHKQLQPALTAVAHTTLPRPAASRAHAARGAHKHSHLKAPPVWRAHSRVPQQSRNCLQAAPRGEQVPLLLGLPTAPGTPACVSTVAGSNGTTHARAQYARAHDAHCPHVCHTHSSLPTSTGSPDGAPGASSSATCALTRAPLACAPGMCDVQRWHGCVGRVWHAQWRRQGGSDQACVCVVAGSCVCAVTSASCTAHAPLSRGRCGEVPAPPRRQPSVRSACSAHGMQHRHCVRVWEPGERTLFGRWCVCGVRGRELRFTTAAPTASAWRPPPSKQPALHGCWPTSPPYPPRHQLLYGAGGARTRPRRQTRPPCHRCRGGASTNGGAGHARSRSAGREKRGTGRGRRIAACSVCGPSVAGGSGGRGAEQGVVQAVVGT
jgi:hypothetical protein